MEKKKLRAVIIEDKPDSLRLLHDLLIANGGVDIEGETSDAQSALDLIIKCNPDILFIDIQMPYKSGFEIVADLKKIKSVNPYIVFTTAHDEFALRAFDYAAFDYLLKPVLPKRLNDTILRCIDSLSSGRSQRTQPTPEAGKKLSFRNIAGIVFIDPAEIIYVEASGNYSIFHLVGERTETVTALIGKIQEMLYQEQFFRISRSSIINLSYLKKIKSKQLQCILLNDGTEIRCEIARERISDLIERMER